MVGPAEAPTCVVCGDPIREPGETPVCLDEEMRDDLGEYDGDAYHLERCEDGVFAEVHCEL